MATLVEYYVVTGGTNGDGSLGNPWNTMDNARAGLATLYPSGLPTADVQVDVYFSGSTQDTAPNSATGVNWSIITDATRYLRLIASASDYATAGPYDTGKYRIVQTNGFRPCITVATVKMFMIGLQMRNTGPRANNPTCVKAQSTAGRETYIYDCYGDFSSTDTPATEATPFYLFSTGSTHKWVMRNCVARGGRYGIRRQNGASGSVTIIDNCTAADNTGYGIEVGLAVGSTLYMRNNVSYNNTLGDYNFTNSGGTQTYGGNRAEDTTSPDASGDSQTFTFVDAANGDFHLAAGDTGAQGQGTDLSADANNPFSTDIDGNARSAPWDSGAHQYTPAGPTYYDFSVVMQDTLDGGGGGGTLIGGGLLR